MIGRRVLKDDPRFDQYGWFNGLLEPGEYVKLEPPTAMQDGTPVEEWILRHYPYWMCESPNGHGGALGAHTIVEHEDGTITVTPSILITTGEGKNRVELWHGFLTKGVWTNA